MPATLLTGIRVYGTSLQRIPLVSGVFLGIIWSVDVSFQSWLSKVLLLHIEVICGVVFAWFPCFRSKKNSDRDRNSSWWHLCYETASPDRLAWPQPCLTSSMHTRSNSAICLNIYLNSEDDILLLHLKFYTIAVVLSICSLGHFDWSIY